jgi:hypothetical protein
MFMGIEETKIRTLRSIAGFATASLIALASSECIAAQGDSLPTTQEFNGALSTCATGADIHVNADLIGSIGSIYNGQRSNGAADFKTATKFLELFPESDRAKVYELYVKCISQILHEQAGSSEGGETGSVRPLPPIPKTDSPVQGWLKPANYPTPPNGCTGFVHALGATLVLIGDNSFGFDGNGKTVVLEIHGCPALSIERSTEGVRFSAEVNDGAGTPPVKIENNRIVAENGETYAATQSADESKLTVKNVKSGRLLLEAEFLNRTTVRVRGVFGCLGLAAIPVENDEPIPGVLMHHFCSMNSRTGIAVN